MSVKTTEEGSVGMKYLDSEEKRCRANFCVSLYSVKSGRHLQDFYFRLNDSEKPAKAVRFICDRFPSSFDTHTDIKCYTVYNGYKKGIC
jgi:hypothetical protein